MPAEPDTRVEDDDFGLWLAACDERLAAGASIASIDEVGVPEELRLRLEVEAAWCQQVRRIWSYSADSEMPSTERWFLAGANASEEMPAELGRFVIRRELGRGSFGIVYLAYDPRLRREVALKVPRGDVPLSTDLRARFRNEAMAAAGLDHPNIVAVYEAGEEGPFCFIASAYCPGITLAAWLRRRSRPVPNRVAAKLVATLADAVEHAHRRGVLHRDLKPSNVLLELAAGQEGNERGDEDSSEPVPRVTDFGLAKLLGDAPASGATMNPTHSGMLIGTPCYMAPEQADATRGAVGPAVDIYSLGVILYETLTGRPPFQGDSVLDTLVLVRTQDALPPSKLRPRLPRDLETICMKCLNKQALARYSTAGALAEDLRRFLAAEPIRARPTPLVERGIKSVRRHPAMATLAGAGATAALVLAIVIVTASVRLKHQRDLAEVRRVEAVANLQKAREAVDRMLTRVSEERLKNIPQVEPVQRALLEDALEFYRGFARDAHDDPEILFEASRAYQRLGRTYLGFGRRREAESCLREGLAIQTKLAAVRPEIAAYRYELVETQISLARLLRDLDRPEEALRVLRDAAAVLDRPTAAEPASEREGTQRGTLGNVRAMVLQDVNQLKAAETDYRKAIELFDELAERFPAVREHRNNAGVCRNNLAVLLETDGRLDEAEGVYRRNLKLWEALAASDASNPYYRSKVALTVDNLSALLNKTGRLDEAEQSLRRVAELRGALSRDYPNTPWHILKLAEAYAGLAKLAAGRRDLEEARRLQEQALSRKRAALELAPENAEYRRVVGGGCGDLVETLILLKEHEEATKLAAEFAVLSQDSTKETLRAGSFMARCVPLAAADRQLPDARRTELAEAYAKRAIVLVREAVGKGYRDIAALRNDRSFDSVRARPDFGSLLAGMDTTPKEAKP
jgi:eukaryotic-like serine/threonine-protein kinase